MNIKQKKEAIVQVLDYLIAEGFVVKEGDKYRYKTNKELKKEMEALLED
jgi:hypothetical protein